jgi:uncharacterized membrane protein HdeD (DUF308 family)
MTAYWFKPKRYGYGATPTTWQGWAVTLGTVAVMLSAALAVGVSGQRGHWALAELLAIYAVCLGTLFIVCRRKTDGEWRWRWGDRS